MRFLQAREARRAGLAIGALIGGVLAGVSAAPVQAATGPLVVGVDHSDPANQQPQNGRVFEYTDFFSRDISVHRGQVVNFQAAPFTFHIVALAKDEQRARKVYPVAFPDKSDPNAPSGAPKVGLGPSNFTIINGSTSHPASGTVDFQNFNGPPECDPAAAPNCVNFAGGDQVQVAGPNPGFGPNGPAPADWKVKITAPEGAYRFFCYIHPGMTGTLHVVDGGNDATTQAQVNKESAEQFARDRAAAMDAEKEANVVRHSDGEPGHRTYLVKVGVAAADDHVAIDEMFPNLKTNGTPPFTLSKGDKVAYQWPDNHNVHSVLFQAMPPTFGNDVVPFGFDCGGGVYQPAGNGPPCPGETESELSSPPFNPPVEFIADPGNAPPGTVLTSPTQLQTNVVDSGVRVGKEYEVNPSSQSWSVATNSSTAGGPEPYLYHCTVHDFMVSGFTVKS